MASKVALVVFLAGNLALGQTSSTRSTNSAGPELVTAPTNVAAQRDKIRKECIEGRRLICGKILDIVPEGLIVESGYTNLLREPINRSWLIPGTAQASKAENIVEGKIPGAVCVGRVLVTDTPKGKKAKPLRYDYVIVEAYPAGECTYSTVSNVQHTVRRFSANLLAAIDANAEQAGRQKKN